MLVDNGVTRRLPGPEGSTFGGGGRLGRRPARGAPDRPVETWQHRRRRGPAGPDARIHLTLPADAVPSCVGCVAPSPTRRASWPRTAACKGAGPGTRGQSCALDRRRAGRAPDLPASAAMPVRGRSPRRWACGRGSAPVTGALLEAAPQATGRCWTAFPIAVLAAGAGDRAWRRLDPSLWDWELAYGKVIDALQAGPDPRQRLPDARRGRPGEAAGPGQGPPGQAGLGRPRVPARRGAVDAQPALAARRQARTRGVRAVRRRGRHRLRRRWPSCCRERTG